MDILSEITREQLVTMLWRYLGKPASDYDLSSFTDHDTRAVIDHKPLANGRTGMDLDAGQCLRALAHRAGGKGVPFFV